MSLPSSKTNPSSPQEEEENVSQDSKRLIATDGMWVLNLGSKGGEGEKVWIASSEENGTHVRSFTLHCRLFHSRSKGN